MNRITWCVAFCVWLLSLSRFLKFIHMAHVRTWLPCMNRMSHGNVAFYLLFRWLGYFQLLTFLSSDTVKSLRLCLEAYSSDSLRYVSALANLTSFRDFEPHKRKHPGDVYESFREGSAKVGKPPWRWVALFQCWGPSTEAVWPTTSCSCRTIASPNKSFSCFC